VSDLFSGSGIGSLLGGLLGGAAANSSANANNALAGHVNMTTTQNPYGPAQPYINGLLQDVYNAIPGQEASYGGTHPLGSGQAAPYQQVPGASGSAAQPTPADPYGTLPTSGGGGAYTGPLVNPINGQNMGINPRSPAVSPAGYGIGGEPKSTAAAPSGGGGGVPTPAAGGGNVGQTGESSQTAAAIQALLNAAGQGSSVYQPSANLISELENGQSTNPDQAQTYANLLSNYRNGNSNLAAMIQQLQSGQTPGATGNTPASAAAAALAQVGGGMSGGGVTVNMPATPQIAAVNQYISNELNAKYNPNSDPNLAAEEQAANYQTEQQFKNTVLPGVNSAAIGDGLMGGSAWQAAEGQAANQYAAALANSNATLQGQNYQEFLTQQNTALQQGASINESAGNNAATVGAAAASASGQVAAANITSARNYAANMAALANQQNIANESALGSAIGTQQAGQQADLSGMGNISNAYSAEQLGALNAAPAISQIPYAGYEAAGSLAEGADKNAVTAQQAADQLKVGEGQIALGNAQLGFGEQQYYSPLNTLGMASNIIGNLSGKYGDTTQVGTNYTGTPLVNPSAQTAAGALGGMNLGSGLGSLLSGLGGGGGSSSGASGGLTPVGNGDYIDSNGNYYDANGNALGSDSNGNPVDPGAAADALGNVYG
jgi:hypothetical protein